MSKNIDTNIVEMKFDNAQFEKKCAQTMSTLEKLKAKINDTGSGDALKGLSSANAIDISHIEKSVDAVANRFTFLGNLAFKIKDQIADAFIGMAKTLATKVPNIIKQGGWERAMNIEKAKFQLEGLHVEWEKIYDDIDYAVAGTAYGLDAAARAASQLVASNVKVGDSMKAALRGISGVAAMTQSQYEEISPIFTTVAGQGKLMTMQLRQLESRGLNAAATLGDALGKSEAEIRDMVTHGQIDFDTFAKAMDDAFGEHAKDANRTFEGVTANIRASLKKVGAAFVTPVIKQDGPVVKALEQLRERMEEFRKSLTPLTDAWEGFIDTTATAAGKILENLDMSFVPSLVNSLTNSFHALLTVITPVAYAIRDVLAPSGMSGVKTFTETLEKFSEKLILSKSEMEDLRATIRGILSVFSIFTTIIKQFLGALIGIDAETVNIRAILLKITGTIGKIITYISIIIKDMNIVGPTVRVVTTALEILVGVLGLTISKIIEFVTWVSKLEITQRILKGISEAAYILAGSVALLATKIVNLVKAIKSGNVSKLGSLGKTLITVKNAVVEFASAIANLEFVQTIIGGIAGAFNMLKESIDELFGKNEKITKTTTTVVQTINDAEVPLSHIAGTIEFTGEAAEEASEGMGSLADNIIRFIKNIPVARILAIGFAASMFMAIYKIIDAFTYMSKGLNNIGGFLTTLKNKGIISILLGTNQTQWKPNKIIEVAIALAAVSAALWSFSRIPTNKLEDCVKVMGKIAVGFVAVVGAIAIMDRFLGYAGALQQTGLAMMEFAAAITVLAGAFRLLSDVNFTNIEQTQHIFAGLLVTLTAMVVITGKMGLAFSKSGLAFVGMATSLLILVKAFDMLNKIALPTKNYIAEMTSKLVAIGVLAVEMIGIAKLCDLVGGKSFMRLASSMLMFTVSIQIVNSLLDKLPKDFSKKLLDRIKSFSDNLKEFFSRAVEIGGEVLKFAVFCGSLVLALGMISGAVTAILGKVREITDSVGKIRRYQDHHKRALNTLATAALVVSIGAVATILTGLTVILVKANLAKNKEAFAAGLTALVIMFGALTGSVVLIERFAKEAKGAAGAALGMVLALATVIATTLGVASYIYAIITKQGDWKSKAAEAAVAAGSLILVLGVFRSIAKSIGKLSGIHIDKPTAAAVIAMITSMGVIVGSVILLSREMTSLGKIGSIAASFVIMGAAMEGFVFLIRQLAKINQYAFKPSTAKVIKAMVLAVIAIAGSLTVLSKYGGTADQMLVAMISISGVFTVFTALVEHINNMKTIKENTFKMMRAIIMEIIAIAGTLIALTHYTDSSGEIIAAATAMGLVFAAFAGMTRVLDMGSYTKNDFKAMRYMIAEIITVAGSLTLLSKVIDDPNKILAAANSMSIVIAAFGTMTIIMSKFKFNPNLMKGMTAVVVESLAVAGALSLLSYYMKDSASVIAAATAMSIVIATFGGMTILLSKMSNTLVGMITLLGVAGAAIMVAEALSKVAIYDWKQLLTGALGLTGVAVALVGLATLAGSLPQSLIGMVTMIAIGLAAIEVGKALSMVAQYDWQNILAAAGALVGTMALFATAATILGSIAPLAVIGAGVLLLIGAVTIPFGYGLKIAAEAMVVFAQALNVALPVTQEFFNTILTTLVTNKDSLGKAAVGLLAMSSALVVLGTAGAILSVGANGLLNTGKAIPLIVNGLIMLSAVNFNKINSGMNEFLSATIKMGTAGVILTAFAPALLVGSTALVTYASAIEKAMNTLKKISLSDFDKLPKKMYEIGRWLPTSLANGMRDTQAYNYMIRTAQKMAHDLEEAVRNVLGVHSLSKIWKSIGEWLPESLRVGMEETFPSLISEGEDGATQLMNTVESVLTDQGFSSDMMDWWGDLGNDLGHWFGENLNITLTAEMTAMVKKMQTVRDAWDKTFGSKYKNVTEHNKAGYYGGVAGPSQITFGSKKAKEAGSDSYSDWLHDIDSALSDIGGEFGTGSGGGSGKGSADRAAEAINRLESAFKGLTKGEKVSLGDMVNNLAVTYKETVSWAADMKMLMGKGFDQNIVDWIKKMGVGGHETVKAFMNASKEEVAYFNAMVPKILSLDNDAAKAIAESYGKGGLAAMQAFASALKTYDSKLAQTVQNALDPFGEFNKKTELTSGQMLSNMQSQLDGIRTWTDNLGKLMERGVNEGIIDKFKEMGPSSYEEVNAMVNMTADQLAKANELWAQQMTIGQEAAISLAQKAEEVGGYVTDGFVQGIRIEDAQAQGVAAGEATIEGMKQGVDAHSPSKKAEQVGIWTMLGLNGGMRKKYDTVLKESRRIGNGVINTLQLYFNETEGKKLGEDLTKGMQLGIKDGSSKVISAIGSLCRSVIDKANEVLDRHSPSRVFRKMFYDVDRGAALGVDDGTGLVLSSIDDMGSSVIDHMAQVIADISSQMDGEFTDISPVITPQLDFTNLQNGKSLIDSMFGGTTMRMAGSISSDAYTSHRADKVAAPIFNQDNTDVVGAIYGLRKDMVNMAEQMASMQVVLDGRTVVGELAPAMDSALGTNAVRAGRGN